LAQGFGPRLEVAETGSHLLVLGSNPLSVVFTSFLRKFVGQQYGKEQYGIATGDRS